MKRTFLRISLIFVILIFFVLKVDAASNPYSKDFNGEINCTWYAWQQAYDKAGVVLPSWGNANRWFDAAKKAGYEVGMTPRVNSIVVWQWNNFGHVGYVERVYDDYIYVWDSAYPDGCPAEMPDLYHCWDNHTLEEVDNGACAGVSTAPHGCPHSKTYWHNEGDLIGYIYLDNAPKTPITSGISNQNTVPTAPVTSGDSSQNTEVPVKKSNNANLSNIKIDNIDFEFNKETLEYNLEVENNIENINIEAISEDSKAKVEGVGEQKLIVGENTINLVVTAEDDSKNVYTIKIKRKDNNAYLTNLEIGNVEFKFDKDTLDYEFKIARNIESITVKAVAESSLATIEGLGTYDLLEEETTIKITVTAEDKTTKNYTIVLKKESKKFFEKMNIWIMIGISIIVLAILIFVIIYLIKKRKNIDKKKIKKEKTKKSNKRHIDIDKGSKN